MRSIFDSPWHYSIGEIFLHVAAAHPRQIAVQCDEDRLTYAEMRSMVLQVAQALAEHEPSGHEPVAILLSQKIQVVAAIMAALTAGRPYVVLDPELPAAQLGNQLDDLTPSLLLSDDRHSTLLAELDTRITHPRFHQRRCRYLLWHQVGATHLPKPSTNPDALATILYTSGSTGRPKGIMHTHRTLLRHISHVNQVSSITAQDCIITLHPLHLGLSQARLLGAMLSGARLLLYDARGHKLNLLGDLLMSEGVSVLATVPLLFRSLCQSLPQERVLSSVRVVQLGATSVRWSDVALFKRHFLPGAMFRLVYAASEALGCSELLLDHESEEMAEGGGVGLPVGRAVEDKEILILDEVEGFATDRRPVTTGTAGEIAVRSEFLSPGYWRDPALTEQKFLPDPEGGNRRIYLTGDRGRLRADGMLELLGRQDLMVKIRGYRIEIEMVEEALRQMSGISEAVVIAQESREDKGESRLVAYCVASLQPAPTASALRHGLAHSLPEPMIPEVFVIMPSLPISAAGKIDRKVLAALPLPPSIRPNLDVPYRAPVSAAETRIAAIWEGVLGIDSVGADDHFLDLGGNSILAARIAAGVLRDPWISLRSGPSQSVSLTMLFAAPTIAEMAALIEFHWNDYDGQLKPLLAELEALSEEEAEAFMEIERP